MDTGLIFQYEEVEVKDVIGDFVKGINTLHRLVL